MASDKALKAEALRDDLVQTVCAHERAWSAEGLSVRSCSALAMTSLTHAMAFILADSTQPHQMPAAAQELARQVANAAGLYRSEIEARQD